MTTDISKSIEVCAAHYGDQADAMREYLIQGQAKALQLDNRGPLLFDKQGHLDEAIRQAYSKYGFYIFEGVMNAQELQDITEDLDNMRQQFPVSSSSAVTENGEPALGSDCKAPNLLWSKPLGDPLGGTAIANGRHQVKLFEPEADADAPAEAPFVMLGSLQFSEACLRAYGHPQLLKVAEEKLDKIAEESRFTNEEVTYNDIAEVVARWTGIPVSKMMQSEKEKLISAMTIMTGKKLNKKKILDGIQVK